MAKAQQKGPKKAPAAAAAAQPTGGIVKARGLGSKGRGGSDNAAALHAGGQAATQTQEASELPSANGAGKHTQQPGAMPGKPKSKSAGVRQPKHGLHGGGAAAGAAHGQPLSRHASGTSSAYVKKGRPTAPGVKRGAAEGRANGGASAPAAAKRDAAGASSRAGGRPASQAPAAGAAAGAKAFSSNWEAMKQMVGATGQGKKRRAEEEADKPPVVNNKKLTSKGSNTSVTPCIAMDCEMVGVGANGNRSIIARVCIINDYGNVLLDLHVKPKETVTDYRTWVSGVKPEHLKGEDVPSLEEVQEKVAKLMKGSILVGHALHNDLKALLLDHPRKDMRDTAKYPLLMRSPAPGRKLRPRALRHLAREELGIIIQEEAHSPVDDARAALYVYHKHRREWERAIATGSLQKQKAKSEAVRKAVRGALEERAVSKGAARKARLGKGKGQNKIAQEIERSASGKADPFKRDIKDDPYADL